MEKALYINYDGSEKHVMPKNGKDFTLDELQKFVGGFIEMTKAKDGRCMVINEEGKLNGLPINQKATDLYVNGDVTPIVGNVLIAPDSMIE